MWVSPPLPTQRKPWRNRICLNKCSARDAPWGSAHRRARVTIRQAKNVGHWAISESGSIRIACRVCSVSDESLGFSRRIRQRFIQKRLLVDLYDAIVSLTREALLNLRSICPRKTSVQPTSAPASERVVRYLRRPPPIRNADRRDSEKYAYLRASYLSLATMLHAVYIAALRCRAAWRDGLINLCPLLSII
jgi:hypothetical protein